MQIPQYSILYFQNFEYFYLNNTVCVSLWIQIYSGQKENNSQARSPGQIDSIALPGVGAMTVDWTVIFSGTVHAVAALELVFWKHLARPVGLAHKGGSWWQKQHPLFVSLFLPQPGFILLFMYLMIQTTGEISCLARPQCQQLLRGGHAPILQLFPSQSSLQASNRGSSSWPVLPTVVEDRLFPACPSVPVFQVPIIWAIPLSSGRVQLSPFSEKFRSTVFSAL